ncbi:Pentatricopeptide repeat-containing protein [Striga hermonthica]|uniref:Pentatricopeptide repeat-containing protein n=1 Tax=Striga hermonthica TaxID=68872 RepID=A0A9N7RPY5_STRHE|nr:Pentatricopeptide repeat-containing protein [Striga hermonthica]
MNLFRELKEFGLRPNAWTYTTVMKCCFKVVGALLKLGRRQDTYSCIAQMVKIGYDRDIVSCNTILYWHVWEGRLENAYSLLNLAAERGLNFDAYTHTMLINGLCKAGDFDGARRHLNHMNKMGYNCLVASNCFIDGLCKFGHLDYALKVFNSMDVKDSCTYSSLIHTLCRKQRCRQAGELLLSCIEAGMEILLGTRSYAGQHEMMFSNASQPQIQEKATQRGHNNTGMKQENNPSGHQK